MIISYNYYIIIIRLINKLSCCFFRFIGQQQRKMSIWQRARAQQAAHWLMASYKWWTIIIIIMREPNCLWTFLRNIHIHLMACVAHSVFLSLPGQPMSVCIYVFTLSNMNKRHRRHSHLSLSSQLLAPLLSLSLSIQQYIHLHWSLENFHFIWWKIRR